MREPHAEPPTDPKPPTCREPVRGTEERETLVAALRDRGVHYLAPSDASAPLPVGDERLLESLAAHPDPRLRQALVALFLLRPELSALVPRIRAALDPRASLELVAHYSAAVYLQRMWRVRLGRHVGEVRDLPDLFSREFGWPPPQEGGGRFGLHAVAEWHAVQSPLPANHLSEYEGVAELLFASLRSRARRHESKTKG